MRWPLAPLALLVVLSTNAHAETIHEGRPAMGTVLEITIESEDVDAAHEAIEACFALVEELEARFSKWRPESELSRLNLEAGGDEIEISPELARILRDALRLAARTEGAFDPTVGPLVALWSQARETGELPEPGQLAAARAAVGWSWIEVDGRKGRLARSGMSVDLAGFTKGWTLDRLGELLQRRGIRRALLDFGQSSMLGIGQPSDAPAWRVLVKDPRGGYAGVVSLRDQSLSVSESFGDSALVGGRRLGHVIDPRSGEPLARQTGAVVVAPTGGAAEAWSKALLVLSPEHALRLLMGVRGTEAMLLEPSGVRRATPGFTRAVDFLPGPEVIYGTKRAGSGLPPATP